MSQPHPGCLEFWAREKPDAPAVIDGARVLSWKAWNNEADRLVVRTERPGGLKRATWWSPACRSAPNGRSSAPPWASSAASSSA